VVLEQADQMHVAANAFIKGVASAPVQPQLHKTRQLAQRADSMVVLAHGADVSGTLPGQAWRPLLLLLLLLPACHDAAAPPALITRCMRPSRSPRCLRRWCRGWAAPCPW
jgi:hypothetical protein